MQYYEKLHDLLGNEFLGVLYALRDIAFFSSIQEEYEPLHYYKYSLIRYDEAEKVLREAKHIIQGNDLNSLYSFKYKFTPKYSDVELLVDLDFKESDHLPDRVIAIIGENGTGKTQLVSSLPKNLGSGNTKLFEPHLPLFSKVIAVSYSVFDTFNIPTKTATFNYVYCGIRKKEGDMMSSVGLKNRFHRSSKEIFATERTIKWRKVLITLLGSEMVDSFLKVDEKQNRWNISLKDFGIVANQLSSGQSILLYIFTEIVANIRYDSLLIFDEPETHLHPNAITILMNTIYSLVGQFQAYCILATHSPIVIRECFSRNVFVLERNDDFPMLRKIEIESFGQNLSVLTNEVFGNKEIQKHYKLIIDGMVTNGMSYNEIVQQLRDEELPLSINVKIYIKSVTK